jgi:type I restriction enzyme M protein
MNDFQDKVSFIWQIADLLRGNYKQHEYRQVILPFTVLRRLDCVLDETKEDVLEVAAESEGLPDEIRRTKLRNASGESFYNTSEFDFQRLLDDPTHIAANLRKYMQGFSENARDILERFHFGDEIDRLDQANLLYKVTDRFASLDLHPDQVGNMQMGYIFEELIRKFSEQSNETAGEHFTPREVIRLMVRLLFDADDELLEKEGIHRNLYDPACGTGGMLAVAEEYLHEQNPGASLNVYGQELNPESYAMCKADMLIKGHQADRIKYGNSFTDDGHDDETFDYMLSNPPFGVSWKNVREFVEDEHERLGHAGRFGAGTPRVNDGSLLFLQHMLDKMNPSNGGSRIGIVFNASPLFTGQAGSGESEIRKWIIENDWLEAIIGLPESLFYNTNINTYIWILSNRKSPERQGKIQVIDATGEDFYREMRSNLGDKRHELAADHIDKIEQLYLAFEQNDHSKIFDNEDFGYRRIKVERPLRKNYRTSEERLERLKEETKFQNRDADQRERILECLCEMPDETYMDVEQFREDLVATWDELFDETLYASEKDTITDALGEKDDEAEVVVDRQGRRQADSDLRDYENVPLKEDLDEYFAEEIEPYVPDAWIDEDYTRVGYEIPFSRHFYEYEPPRDPEEIEDDIRELEDEIQGLLGEVPA